MKNFIPKNNQTSNVEIAENILEEIGVDIQKIRCTGYSDTNGVSVYFYHEALQEDKRIRVSNHSISNRGRMEDTICFSFDSKTLRGNIKSNIENNKTILEKNFSFLK